MGEIFSAFVPLRMEDGDDLLKAFFIAAVRAGMLQIDTGSGKAQTAACDRVLSRGFR